MNEQTGNGEKCCDKGHMACKVGAALVLLAIGAVGGFVCGKKCATGSCPLMKHGSPAPAEAPATPTQPR